MASGLEGPHSTSGYSREPTCGGRVLLVDDDADVRRAYAKLLTRLGCKVQTAESGDAAMQVLRDGLSVDLVVSDVGMAGMSGTELLRVLREQHLDVPVILMTGSPGAQASVDAVDYGAFRYLTKPVDFDTLGQAVRGAIHTHVMARALADRIGLLEVCRRIVRATCKGPEWDFAAIWVPGQAEQMHCVHTWARSGHDVSAFVSETRNVASGAWRGLPGRAWASGSPEWISDISPQSTFPRAAVVVACGFRSGFAVPIGAEGEVFAIIEFFSRRHHAPDLHLLELFATSSTQLAAQVLRERADQRATRAEFAQRTISSTLNAVMECAPAFIIAVNEEGKIQFINRVMSHHRMDDVIGSDWLQYMPPPEHEQHRANLRRVLSTGTAQTWETTTLGPDGAALWFTSHMAPLRDNDKIVGAVLVAQEITQLKRAQAENAATQRLATVGTMAAGIAHEVNTPVQFVNDSVQFLRDAAQDTFALLDKMKEVCRLASAETTSPALRAAIVAVTEGEAETDLPYLEENVPRAFERCLDGLGRISTIVRSMKEFSHPAQHEMAPVDLNRALQSTLTIARGEYKYVADLEVDLGELPLVNCHVNDINQVVLNLVVNAAHAIGDVVQGTENKGTIRVRTRHEGDHVAISISDTGPGIPAAIAQRIFEPFFTTKEVGKGTGQGLALAWAVVREKHGGELTFDTKLGEGTTFSVRLPVGGKQKSQPSSRVSRPAAARN